MSISRVQTIVQSTYGCSQLPLIRNALMLGEYLIYLNGNQIVKHSTIHNNQRVALKPAQDQMVTAMNFHYESKMMICMGVKLNSGKSVIRVYTIQNERDLSNFQTFQLPNQEGMVIDISFYEQTNYIVSLFKTTQGISFCVNEMQMHHRKAFFVLIPEPVLFITELNQLDIFYLHYQRNLFSVQLNADARQFMVTKPNYSPPFQILSLNYLPQTSLFIFLGEERVVLATDKAQIFELWIQSQPELKDFVPFCMCKLGKGFALGFKNIVAIALFVVEYQKIQFKNIWRLPQDPQFPKFRFTLNLHPSVDNMQIAVTVVTQLFKGESGEHKVTLFKPLQPNQRIELYNFNVNMTQYMGRYKLDPFTSITNKFQHMGEILGIASSVNKKLLFSLGLDRKLVAYTYSPIDAKNLDSSYDKLNFMFNQSLSEVPTCLALHPSSLTLAVGFRQSLRLYFVLQNQFSQYRKQQNRNCTAIQFSEGGNLIAVGVQSAAFLGVCVYDFLTLDVVSQIPLPKQVTKIVWSQHRLGISCKNRFYYMGMHSDSKRASFSRSGSVRVSRVFWDSKFGVLTAVQQDHQVQLLKFSEPNNSFQQFFSYQQKMGLITAMKTFQNVKICILGSDRGAIRVDRWPLDDCGSGPPCTGVFTSQITCIESSMDNKFILLGSAQGAVTILGLKIYGADKINEMQFVNSGYNNFYLDAVKLVPLSRVRSAKQIISSLVQKRQQIVNESQQFKVNFKLKSNEQLQKLQQKNNDFQEANLKDIIKVYHSTKDRERDLRRKWKQLNAKKASFFLKREQSFNKEIISLYDRNALLTQSLGQISNQNKRQEINIRNQFFLLSKQLISDLKRRKASLISKLNQLKAKTAKDYPLMKQLLKREERDLYNHRSDHLELQMQKLMQTYAEQRVSFLKNQKELQRFSDRGIFLSSKRRQVQEFIVELNERSQTFQIEKKILKLEVEENQNKIFKKEQQLRKMVNQNDHLLRLESVFNNIALSLSSEYRPMIEHSRMIDSNYSQLNEEVLALIVKKEELHKREMHLQHKYKQSLLNKKRRNEPLLYLNRIKENYIYKAQITLRDQLGNQQFISKIRELTRHFFDKQLDRLQNMMRGFTIQDMFEFKIGAGSKNQFQETLTGHLNIQRNQLKKRIKEFQEQGRHQSKQREEELYRIQNYNSNLIFECNNLNIKLKKKKKNYQEKIKNLKIFQGRAQNQAKILEQEKKLQAVAYQTSYPNSLAALFSPKISNPAPANKSTPYLRKLQQKRKQSEELMSRTQTQTSISRPTTQQSYYRKQKLVRTLLNQIQNSKGEQ